MFSFVSRAAWKFLGLQLTALSVSTSPVDLAGRLSSAPFPALAAVAAAAARSFRCPRPRRHLLVCVRDLAAKLIVHPPSPPARVRICILSDSPSSCARGKQVVDGAWTRRATISWYLPEEQERRPRFTMIAASDAGSHCVRAAGSERAFNDGGTKLFSRASTDDYTMYIVYLSDLRAVQGIFGTIKTPPKFLQKITGRRKHAKMSLTKGLEVAGPLVMIKSCPKQTDIANWW
ncbi:hypothetical protein C8R47DRAFT_1084016 [Mycena vitilis]|nr:hypothetical protein C8R47DRAFT_1084016 [Mycena vitilis]